MPSTNVNELLSVGLGIGLKLGLYWGLFNKGLVCRKDAFVPKMAYQFDLMAS